MPDEVVQTPFGKFLITPEDLIGSTLKAGTLWDGPGFLQPIAQEHGGLGEKGVTILDIGANQGAFSVWLAAHHAWRVIAVEPVPEMMQRLKANLDLNREVTGSVVLPLEIAAYDVPVHLGVPQLDWSNTGGTSLCPIQPLTPEERLRLQRRVRACALDKYRYLFGHRVSLVKVDAQGCDGPALFGLRETLKHDHPAVVFEWEADLAIRHGRTFSETKEMLEGLGYRVEEWPSQPNNYLAVWNAEAPTTEKSKVPYVGDHR